MVALTRFTNITVADSLLNETGQNSPSFLETMNISESSLAEQSYVVYIDILDEYADYKDTIPYMPYLCRKTDFRPEAPPSAGK